MLMSCKQLSRDHIPNAISITRNSGIRDFRTAKEIAFETARTKVPEPMLLAWYEKKTGRFSPPVQCCDEEKPSWLVYAESRGGEVVVDINDLEYVFVFCNSSLSES